MKKVLITGGGGFVGKALGKELLKRGDFKVCSLSRKFYPELEKSGIKQCSYDLCLLYTSPSPRDATLSRMPSSA